MPADAKIAGIAIAHEELGIAALLGQKCSDFAATGQLAMNKTRGPPRRDLVRFAAGSVDYSTSNILACFE